MAPRPEASAGGGAILAGYHARLARGLAVIALVVLLLAASFVLDVVTGPALLPLEAVLRALTGLGSEAHIDVIVRAIRLPSACLAVLAGICLALSGVIMQTILNNPLASSYTLGISAGAGFGAALVILAGSLIAVPESYAVPLAAFAFAGLASGSVYAIGRARGATPEILVLAGIAMLFLFQALLALVQFIASPEALQAIVFWLFGSLQKASWPKVSLMAIIVALTAPLLMRDVWKLTALRLGDERARALGVDVARLRLRSLVLISLLTGIAVAFAGTIGFVGLVAPHVARMLVGEDQRLLLPAAALIGALTLSLSSIVSKILIPGAVFPIGIVTALIGVPFFIWLILSKRSAFW